MKIIIDKSFEKDTLEISDKKILQSIASYLKDVQKMNKFSELPNCKKLKGSKKAYRIRIGHYRMGIILENQTIYFIRCLHRSKIYHYFPA